MTKPNPTHLFISYAPEDLPVANWLARKLAALGYPIWFDKLKTLGGEPWPHSLDEIVKDRTFRMLALVSEHSTRKKKPLKEHMLAQRVVRQQNISDFFIPLTLDDSELDPLIAAAPAIPFENDWGNGLETLLKRLDSLKAKRSLKDGASLAATSFPRGRDLVNDAAGRIFANLVRVKSFPKTIRIFQPADNLTLPWRERLEDLWTFYETPNGAFAALIPPPPEFDDFIKPARGQLALAWSGPGLFQGRRTRELAAAIIRRALARRLLNAGCLRDPNLDLKETFYLPTKFSGDGQVTFTSFEGRQVSIAIRNKVAFRRIGGVTETDFHHFAFRVRLARGLDENFYVQLIPTLIFFNEHGKGITDKNAAARIRRVTQTWNNEEWLNRVTAAEYVLNSVPPAGLNDPILESGLLALDSPKGLDEAVLAAPREKAREAVPEQEFELDEPDESEGADE